MPVQFPLHLLAQPGEEVPLPGDQPVQLGAGVPGQITVSEEPTLVEATDADQRTVVLDGHPGRQGIGYVGAQLGVVGGTQGGDVEITHPTRLCFRMCPARSEFGSTRTSCKPLAVPRTTGSRWPTS